VATFGTLLVLAVFSAFVVTVGDSTRSLGAGSTPPASQPAPPDCPRSARRSSSHAA
jgi:hypothetical protein